MQRNQIRLVSLVPSLTETVAYYWGGELIVGRTHFCVSPASLERTSTRIGGTKDPDLDKIMALRPTHILANEEENKPEHMAWLRERVPTLTTHIRRLADVRPMMVDLARFLDRPLPDKLEIPGEGDLLVPFPRGCRYLYFIWRDPLMVAGPDTYISSMLAHLGMENAADTPPPRYPEVTTDQIRELDPSVIFLSSEPFAFRKRHIKDLGPLATNCQVWKIDGKAMSWYGATTYQVLEALKKDNPGKSPVRRWL